jgi:hypothetical protein
MREKHQKENKEFFLSNLPIELSRCIYDYIPHLYCSQCYKKLINYRRCHIYYHIRINQNLFCSYYCAIRNKYIKYTYFFQLNFLIITLRIAIVFSYVIIIPYILLNLIFIIIFKSCKLIVLGTF